VNITSGFRAPSVTELFGPFGSNPALKPERSATQEAGLQSWLVENKLEFIVTGFNRVINNVIIYGNNGYENRDKQHDYGAEVELSYSPDQHFNCKLTYDYVNGKITQKTGGKDTTYYNLIRRPKNNMHLFISYRFNDFIVSGSLQITGKRIDTYYNPAPSQVNLSSYALLNLYAAYDLFRDKLSVFVDGKNITNNKSYYEVYGFSVPVINITGGLRFQL